jgi:hypothetical protein
VASDARPLPRGLRLSALPALTNHDASNTVTDKDRELAAKIDELLGWLCVHSSCRSELPADRLLGLPLLLGRGVRLWDGVEGVEDRYDIETVSSPSGVTHLTFTRR